MKGNIKPDRHLTNTTVCHKIGDMVTSGRLWDVGAVPGGFARISVTSP
uniref:Uncharacterized protein n=1 Tax=Anguilla anguilla TaxID=7936 RepID=A0A0E9Q7L8_ANGAN